MDRNEVKSKINAILISVLNHEKFEMSEMLTATDVDGWDSLTHMMIISEVEKAFSITFKLKELNKMKNMGDMLDFGDFKIIRWYLRHFNSCFFFRY